MKKLIITLCAAAITAGIQAATFSWNTGQLFSPKDATGAKGSGVDYAIRSATGSTLSWYVFEGLSATDYASAQTAGNVYGFLTTAPQSGSKLVPLDSESKEIQGTTSSAAGNTISSDKYSALETVNWAAVIVYTDDSGAKWYTEATGTSKFDELGTKISVSNIGKNVATWTKAEAVPEPTSGLLLLLGVAGLALKRRRA